MINMLLYQILPYTIHGKNINLNYQLQRGIKNLSYLISYSVPDIQDYFEYIIRKHETVTDNSPRRIYVNETENSIIFRIKSAYYLELLTTEMMK